MMNSKKNMIRAVLIVLAMSAQSLWASKAAFVETMFPTEDYVIANVSMEPTPSKTDGDSARIQKVIDQLAKKGGGVIFLRAGHYTIDQSILLRQSVTIRGDWVEPTEKNCEKGTILNITADHGNENTLPAFIMKRNSGLRELTFYYPNQDPLKPVPYPWTVGNDEKDYDRKVVNQVGMELAPMVKNCTFVNPYRAITTSTWNNGQYYFINLYLSPLKVGVACNFVTDIGRTAYIHVSPRWWEEFKGAKTMLNNRQKSALRDYMLKNASGLTIGRHDWTYMYDINVEGCKNGIYCHKNPNGIYGPNGVLFRANIRDCEVALNAENVISMGIAFTGCSFEGRKHAVLKSQCGNSALQFNSCSFSSESDSAVLIDGGYASFVNCTFETWAGAAAVYAPAGALSVVNCDFEQPKTHVRMDKKVYSGSLLSNRFKGAPRIQNYAKKGVVEIDHEQQKFAKPNIEPMNFPPEPQPERRALYSVLDFGASPDLDDNTEAFQKALDKAGKEGGGTVYVPAGDFYFESGLTIPSGVELRGIYEGPHHTTSPGSLLLPLAGRGYEEGTPFIQMESESGMRGITIYYPQQDWYRSTPYPWTIRNLGPGCWLMFVTLSNPYQGVDFWTNPSEGHHIKYLAGSPIRRGLFVSKSKNKGWIQDSQFVCNYAIWTPTRLNNLDVPANDWRNVSLMTTQMDNLEAYKFGNLADEQVMGTFVYCSHAGLTTAADDYNGHILGPNMRVVQHGTDLGAYGFRIQAVGNKGVEFINSEQTPNTYVQHGGIVVEDSCKGEVSFFNSASWSIAKNFAYLKGDAKVTIQQFNNRTGPIFVEGSNVQLDVGHYDRPDYREKRKLKGRGMRELLPHVNLTEEAKDTRLIGHTVSQNDETGCFEARVGPMRK
ncbi:glycosyl hydrolase family 28-related protein [Pontiella sulfatireligans]|nr:glycosyl hydrolase family 28-related protein [Pontiella sulfatireligans]